MKRVSVVVPLLNEEEIVDELVNRIATACRSTGLGFEVIVVNDGSTDHTLERLVSLTQAIPELTVLDLVRNYGQMAALSAGIARATGDAVVVLDGDLQDPPELITAMVEAWQAGAEVVLGKRHGSDDSPAKKVASRIFHWLAAHLSSVNVPEEVGTYGLMDRRITDIVMSLPERSRDFARLRAWAGGRAAEVVYRRAARKNGPSRFGVIGLTGLAIVSFTSFSKTPLRLASLGSLGFGLSLLVVGGVAVVLRIFTHSVVPGWAATTVLIGLMGFVQSTLLAILAEYVAVIFDEVKARPLYFVREAYSSGRPEGTPPRA
jgi:glycosyltransferase involved in cell wall biosynthesis